MGKSLKNGLKNMDIKYYIFLICALFICYGFTLTNYSISIDDEAIHRYIFEYGWLGQGRWFSTL